LQLFLRLVARYR
jgi:hypothetical protein